MILVAERKVHDDRLGLRHLSGELVHVGVATLIPSDQPNRNPGTTHVTGTIGSYLLSSGDAIGVEA